MRRHWFYILLSLAERERHGSGIMRDVLELTDGDLRLWTDDSLQLRDEVGDHAPIAAERLAQVAGDALDGFRALGQLLPQEVAQRVDDRAVRQIAAELVELAAAEAAPAPWR